MEINQWINHISNMADSKWELIDCIDKQVLCLIKESERNWIERECSEKFSYKDNLLEAQYIARVLAGLNYAGKKKVKEEIRRKAFLYACIYMKRLLMLKKIWSYKSNVIEWKEIESSNFSNEISKFLVDTDHFNNSQKYILVLGNEYN